MPQALRNRKAEVIILPLDEEPSFPESTDDTQLLADEGVLEFAGCLPDFPERDSQF